MSTKCPIYVFEKTLEDGHSVVIQAYEVHPEDQGKDVVRVRTFSGDVKSRLAPSEIGPLSLDALYEVVNGWVHEQDFFYREGCVNSLHRFNPVPNEWWQDYPAWSDGTTGERAFELETRRQQLAQQALETAISEELSRKEAVQRLSKSGNPDADLFF